MGDPSQHDLPAPGDYNGDGTTDLAVFRPATDQWIIQFSTGGTRIVQLGDPSQHDVPVPADYDGDRTTDLAVFRPATDEWLIRLSSTGGVRIAQVGVPSQHDIPVTGDYNHAGEAGFAVFRPGSATFILRYANGNGRVESFGDPAQGDRPAGYVGGGITMSGFASPSSGDTGVHASGRPATQGVTPAPRQAAGRPKVVAAAEHRHAARGARHHGAAWLAALERLDAERHRA